MQHDDGRKYGLVRGGLYGRSRYAGKGKPAAMGFTTLEFQLEQEMHSAFVAMEGEDGQVPSRGVQDIRERRQHPWRVIARRFREAHAAGVPKDQLREVCHLLVQYVDRLGERPRRRA